MVHDIRSPRSLDTPQAAADYQQDLLAEYVLARSAQRGDRLDGAGGSGRGGGVLVLGRVLGVGGDLAAR